MPAAVDVADIEAGVEPEEATEFFRFAAEGLGGEGLGVLASFVGGAGAAEGDEGIDEAPGGEVEAEAAAEGMGLAKPAPADDDTGYGPH